MSINAQRGVTAQDRSVHVRAASLLSITLALPFASAEGAVFCVTSGNELQAALNSAEVNMQADEIHIAVGQYLAPAAAGYEYNAAAVAAGDDLNIDISGGWTELPGSLCGERLDSTPASATVLDGDHRFRALAVVGRSNTKVSVRQLKFIGGTGSTSGALVGVGAGLAISVPQTLNSAASVENCWFSDNTAEAGSALYMRAGELRVRNSLFVDNHALNRETTRLLAGNRGVYFTNNTVVDNTVGASPPSTGGVYVESGGQYYVANNILWGNSGVDAEFVGASIEDNYFLHNDYESLMGQAPDVSVGNIQSAPQFDSAVAYTPADASVLVDSGVSPPDIFPPPPVPFAQNWSTGVADLAGNARKRNTAIDIGAFESAPPLLRDGFE
jgi:hypothetical protein